MSEDIGSKRKILKNTIVLYVRMIVTMLIALYTSRVLLKALGIEDYGLYDVVGGTVALFSFLKTSLASATQRFMSYELGKATNDSDTNLIFNASVTTHILLAVIILLLCETIGLWFLNTQLNIPEGREYAANVIYHFSVVAICVSMLTVPYHACVISHEDMGFFAFIGIFDSLLKLGIAIAVAQVVSEDKLIFYGFLIMLLAILDQIIYTFFCRKSYKECNFMFCWDKTITGRILSFSSWTLIGQLAVVASNYGSSILVNVFYSVSLNAAIGVAQQVNTAISGLVANFQTAYQPQITKAYASKNYQYQNDLIMQASKVSYLLMFMVSLPVIFNIEDLLNIWLSEVPKYTSQFCIYFMAASMLNAIGGPLWMSIFATGNIKSYQIATSLAYLSDVIIVFVLFELGFSPLIAFAVKVVVNGALVIIRMIYCNIAISFFSLKEFFVHVLLPLALCTFVSVLVGLVIFYFAHSILIKVGATFLLIALTIVISFFVGLSRDERDGIYIMIKNKVKSK